MSLYKRKNTWWTDFSIHGRRLRVSLKTSDKREAIRREKSRISELQDPGASRSPWKNLGVPLPEAADSYLLERRAMVSPSTIRLETDALKPVRRHLGGLSLGTITLDILKNYVVRRKAVDISNRTINIEIGVLKRILKARRLWHIVGEFPSLPERRDIGRALSPQDETKLFFVAGSRLEWEVAFLNSLVGANTTAQGCELRNLQLRDLDLEKRILYVRVGKNRFRIRPIPLNRTATWAVVKLLGRAKQL